MTQAQAIKAANVTAFVAIALGLALALFIDRHLPQDVATLHRQIAADNITTAVLCLAVVAARRCCGRSFGPDRTHDLGEEIMLSSTAALAVFYAIARNAADNGHVAFAQALSDERAWITTAIRIVFWFGLSLMLSPIISRALGGNYALSLTAALVGTVWGVAYIVAGVI